jgi:plasmid stabilization system protein ParE
VSFRLVVRPQVDDELQIIEEWYEEHQPGLWSRVSEGVRETIDRLLVNPLIYRSRYDRRQVRWAYTRRFPYRVIFRVIDHTVIVYTVVHAARRDHAWKQRVE